MSEAIKRKRKPRNLLITKYDSFTTAVNEIKAPPYQAKPYLPFLRTEQNILSGGGNEQQKALAGGSSEQNILSGGDIEQNIIGGGENEQNILSGGDIERNILGEGEKEHNVVGEGGSNDDVDDENNEEDYDLRRKLRRLTGPGGAFETDVRGAPHLISPGGVLSPSSPSDESGSDLIGGASSYSPPGSEELAPDLKQGAVEGIDDLSEIFSDIGAFSSDRKPQSPSASRQAKEEDADSQKEDDEWGSFDDDDWRNRVGKSADEDEASLRPRGAGLGEDVPGLLGGERFVRGGDADVEGEEGLGGEEVVTEEAPPSHPR